MQNAVILRKNPNEGVPSDIIQKVLETYKGSWGAAYINEGSISVASEATPMTLEQFEEIQTELLDKHVMFYFAQPVEHQPYILVSEKDDPMIVGFLEGNFRKITKSEDTASNESVIGERWLSKKLQKVYTHLEGDMEKVVSELREVESEIDFLNMIEDRGVFELLTSSGDVISFHKGIDPLIQPWGWMSHKLGFGEDTKPVEKPVETKKDTLSAFRSSKNKAIAAVQKAAAPSTPKTETAVKAPVPGDALKKPDQGIIDAQNNAHNASPAGKREAADREHPEGATRMCWWTPKKGSTHSQLKKHYKNVCDGVLPNNWKNGPTVEIAVSVYEKFKGQMGGNVSFTDPKAGSPSLTAKSFEEMGNAMKKALEPEVMVDPKPVTKAESRKQPAPAAKPEIKVSSRKEGPAPTASVPEVKPSDIKPKHVTPEMAKPVTASILPILSPERRNAVLQGELIHTLDKNSLNIEDPKSFLEGSKRVPTLMEQLGLDNEAMLRWPYELVKKFSAENPDAMAIMWHDMRCAHIRLADQIKHLEGKLEEKNKTVEDQPVKVAAKGGSSFFKNAKKVA